MLCWLRSAGIGLSWLLHSAWSGSIDTFMAVKKMRRDTGPTIVKSQLVKINKNKESLKSWEYDCWFVVVGCSRHEAFSGAGVCHGRGSATGMIVSVGVNTKRFNEIQTAPQPNVLKINSETCLPIFSIVAWFFPTRWKAILEHTWSGS